MTDDQEKWAIIRQRQKEYMQYVAKYNPELLPIIAERKARNLERRRLRRQEKSCYNKKKSKKKAVTNAIQKEKEH